MSTNSLVRFTRSCPTCGRRIQIRGSLLGKVVACQHCNAEFVAMATDQLSGCVDDAQRLMDRVDSALSRSQSARQSARQSAPQSVPLSSAPSEATSTPTS